MPTAEQCDHAAAALARLAAALFGIAFWLAVYRVGQRLEVFP